MTTAPNASETNMDHRLMLLAALQVAGTLRYFLIGSRRMGELWNLKELWTSRVSYFLKGT